MKRLHIVLAVRRHVLTSLPRLSPTHRLSMVTASLQATIFDRWFYHDKSIHGFSIEKKSGRLCFNPCPAHPVTITPVFRDKKNRLSSVYKIHFRQHDYL
jgi:hypothetical protein